MKLFLFTFTTILRGRAPLSLSRIINVRILRLPVHYTRSIRTSRLYIYIHTRRQSRVLFSNVELSWQVGSLLSRISARGCGVCVQHTRTSAHFLVHTYTRIQVHRSGRGIYRVFYCNRCLLLRGPGDAVTFSASPLLELVLAAFARVPPSPRVASPAVTHREAFFALFAT